MDGNGILLWVAGIALVLTAIQAANRSRADARELLVVCSVILVAAAVCWLWAPAIAGYVAAGGYAVAVVCPALLTVAFQGALDRRRWISARAVSLLLLMLRPTAGMRSFTAMGLAAAEAETGDIEAAQQLLAPAEGASEAARRAITVMRLHVAQRWDELLAVIDAIDPEERDRDPMLAMYRLRALGEVGRIDEIAHEYRTLEAAGALGHPRMHHLVWVGVLAFAGRRTALARLLPRHAATRHADRAAFWLATASWAAGDADAARRELTELERDASPGIRRAIVRRIAHPPARAAASPVLSELADRMESVVSALPPLSGPLWVTRALIAANLVMFVVTVLWSTRRLDALRDLGAFDPAAVRAGEWWRLGSCLFLHLDVVHLLMNMLGLYVLGRLLEPRLGRLRFLAIYLAAGLAGTCVAFVLATLDPSRHALLVGASGCVMGMVGALAVEAFRDWRAGSGSRRQLESIGMQVVFQVAFDLFHPEVSATAHLVGLAVGVVLAAGIHDPGRPLTTKS